MVRFLVGGHGDDTGACEEWQLVVRAALVMPTAHILLRVVVLLGLQAPAARHDDLEIRFLDIGQGDAILIREGSAAALVDAGLPDDSIVERLHVLGVDSLRFFLASHNHGDHIGSADRVLEALHVGLYVDNGAPLPTPSEQRVEAVLRQRSIPTAHGIRRTFVLGDAQVEVIPPPPSSDTLQNNLSMVVRIHRGRFTALLTGDSERGEIERLLGHETLGHVDVLKAPHHGDPEAQTAEWLRMLSPDVVVVSVGEGNFSSEAASRYAATGRRLFRTDRDGDVSILVDAADRLTVKVGPRRTFHPRVPPRSH